MLQYSGVLVHLPPHQLHYDNNKTLFFSPLLHLKEDFFSKQTRVLIHKRTQLADLKREDMCVTCLYNLFDITNNIRGQPKKGISACATLNTVNALEVS